MLCFHNSGVNEQERRLDQDIRRYRRLAYSSNTKQAYRSQRDAYLRFCAHFGYSPIPTTDVILCRYAAFLARTIKPVSISCYMNVIRVMHLEAGHQNPLLDNWNLSLVIRGIRRDHNKPAKVKLPITPDILSAIYTKLDFSKPIMSSFWAACLVGFFSFFRKSTLLPKSLNHDCKTELCRQDILFTECAVIINVKHTKTLQFHDRLLQVPLPQIVGSVLCPVMAIKNLMDLSQDIPPYAPLFSYPTQLGRYSCLTHVVFVKILRLVLSSCGLPANEYSGHSFRRGGASFAFSSGVPTELIKSQGDWKSSAYERYLSCPLDQRLKLTRVLALNLNES